MTSSALHPMEPVEPRIAMRLFNKDILLTRLGLSILLVAIALLEVLENFASAHLCSRPHAIEQQGAVEVIHFVLPDAGDVVGLQLSEGLAFDVAGFHLEALAAEDFGSDLGQTQAAFFAFLLAERL